MQDLPDAEVREDLIEDGQADEILQKSCPAEYSGLKEEEVENCRFRNTMNSFYSVFCSCVGPFSICLLIDPIDKHTVLLHVLFKMYENNPVVSF